MADETYPEELKYHPEHDWARIEGDEATFGITWYAQDSLGEVVFFEPPEVGATISKDGAYAEVESVKAVSDVIAPLSGEVTAVNEALSDSPEKINEDPYGEGWLVKVKLTEASEAEALLDAGRVQGTSRRLTDSPLTASGRHERLAPLIHGWGAFGVGRTPWKHSGNPQGVSYMHLLRGKPSPAMVVAVCALAFAMVGTAVAGTDGLNEKITKSKVKKIAKKQTNKAAPGLNVNSAKTADSATNATNATNASNADCARRRARCELRNGLCRVRPHGTSSPIRRTRT